MAVLNSLWSVWCPDYLWTTEVSQHIPPQSFIKLSLLDNSLKNDSHSAERENTELAFDSEVIFAFWSVFRCNAQRHSWDSSNMLVLIVLVMIVIGKNDAGPTIDLKSICLFQRTDQQQSTKRSKLLEMICFFLVDSNSIVVWSDFEYVYFLAKTTKLY